MSKTTNGRKSKIVGLSEYIQSAMTLAHYEWCDDVKQFAGFVDELPGCWSQAKTIEAARQELMEVIEGWIILGLQHGDPIPDLIGLRLGRDMQAERRNRKHDGRSQRKSPSRKPALSGTRA